MMLGSRRLALLTKLSQSLRFVEAFSPTPTVCLRLQSASTRKSRIVLNIIFDPAAGPADVDLCDLILVSSGNGACGFLSHYLERTDNKDARVLVLERGKCSFFYTSDVTHQSQWTRSFVEGVSSSFIKRTTTMGNQFFPEEPVPWVVVARSTTQ